jgi:hypothetical protein
MSHMQLTHPDPLLKMKNMEAFQPVTVQEVKNAYETLLAKGRSRIRVPSGFRGIAGLDDPAISSLLPVGCDGMTTVQVERDEASKSRFLAEVVRMFNEDDRITGKPKFRLKRFSVQVKKEKRGDKEKERRTVLICLRDQVAMRVLLERLKKTLPIRADFNDMFGIIRAMVSDLRMRKGIPVVIKTDIAEFHPSVDRGLLMDQLRNHAEGRLDDRTLDILSHAVEGHRSAKEVTGLPMGLSISVLLAEFYAQKMHLDALLPGVCVYRYADDIVLVADEGEDPNMILKALDRRLEAFRLRRNELKTKVVSDEPFTFLGVDFYGARISIDDARVRKWANSVWAEVSKDMESHHILRRLGVSAEDPGKAGIIRNAFREFKRGSRSSYWKFLQRVRALDGSIDASEK